MRRFFVPLLDPAVREMALPADVAHHLCTVLRCQVGYHFVLCDGCGGCAQARLLSVAGKKAVAALDRFWQQPETALPLTLYQALPAGDKFDLILQKNTELGVGVFAPLFSERCQFSRFEKKFDKKVERWQRIVQEAARQSQRSWLPTVLPPGSLQDVLAGCQAGLRLVLWEGACQPLDALLPRETPVSAAILVGPEGGLSDADVALAVGHGFQPVALGPRILRTETAGFALTSILQYRYGDLSHQIAAAD
ncbi:MAG: 16S rRNA (uracil(1498)-N(3))-methyltransferase [Desulfuromonadaceae bacterium]|nr:16S rRNA (uracil(1498)-N(3))-methyltransferase [Desulfuromonadaceae bacterium]